IPRPPFARNFVGIMILHKLRQIQPGKRFRSPVYPAPGLKPAINSLQFRTIENAAYVKRDTNCNCHQNKNKKETGVQTFLLLVFNHRALSSVSEQMSNATSRILQELIDRAGDTT